MMLKKLINKLGLMRPKQKTFSVDYKVSYSQSGEDCIVNFLFKSLGIDNVFYIDIGANHPIRSNNTYLFSEQGCKGIIVEPDVSFHNIYHQFRPNDTILSVGLSDKDSGNEKLFVFDNNQLNTFSKSEAISRQQSGRFKLIKTVYVPVINLETIIIEYMKPEIPHLISLDIEGMDFQVLQAFDFNRFPIPVLVIETCEYSETHVKSKNMEILNLMADRGYLVYADTYINTIFVHKAWFEMRQNPN